jgi:hypothetical protein
MPPFHMPVQSYGIMEKGEQTVSFLGDLKYVSL